MPAIPIKDYLYIGAIIALLVFFGFFVHHERGVGAAKVVAADSRAVAAQVQRDDALRTVAALSTSVAQGDYSHAISTPIVNAPVPVRLCHNAQRSSPVPSAASPDSSGTAAPAGGSEDAGAVTELQQFADAAVQIARDDDAQIIALQTDLAALRTEMNQLTKVSK